MWTAIAWRTQFGSLRSCDRMVILSPICFLKCTFGKNTDKWTAKEKLPPPVSLHTLPRQELRSKWLTAVSYAGGHVEPSTDCLWTGVLSPLQLGPRQAWVLGSAHSGQCPVARSGPLSFKALLGGACLTVSA